MSTRVSSPARQSPGPVRERILQAALALLGEGGVQRLTQVQVAARAGVRQSHLTYYFPTRPDLIEAVASRYVETLSADFDRVVAGPGESEPLLARLVRAIADPAHMRMFVGIIVAADDDPAVRAIVARMTGRMEKALAEALGGAGQLPAARAALAALWGLGLYAFVLRPPTPKDPTPAALAWLTAALPPGAAVSARIAAMAL